jgi:DNA-binding NarL/FixJ family response regulator
MTDELAPVRVLVVDDEALIRAGFRALLESAEGFTVTGEASTGAQAVRQARQDPVDVVLMDIRMPIMDGLEATRLLAAAGPTPRVLIVTTFDQDEHVFGALRAGASGFVLKDTAPERLLEAIRTIARGQSLLDPVVTRRLIEAYVEQAPRSVDDSPLEVLTDRERDVLEQVAIGRSNIEIAEALFLGVSTVKTHIGRLLTKLKARDRAQLVVIAYETGIVTPG